MKRYRKLAVRVITSLKAFCNENRVQSQGTFSLPKSTSMIILKISSGILNYQVTKYGALSAVSWKSLLRDIKQGTFQMIF